MNKYKKIGILGGMGPLPTAELYLRIIRLFQVKLNAKFDSDFPEFVINSITTQGVLIPKVNEKKLLRKLISGCKSLEKSKVDFIVIPCNSAHKYIETMRKSVKIPIISIIEETIKQIIKKRILKVLILGTAYSIKNRLFQKILLCKNIKFEIPHEKQQKKITRIIMNIQAGQNNNSDKENLTEIINLYKDNIDGVILGCTELPLIVDNDDVTIPIFDTIDVLANSAYNYSINVMEK